MNLRRAIGREKRIEGEELNITPVMNIFLILVPFLLLTAVFVKISILEFSLPGSDGGGSPEGSAIVTVLTISNDGFELKSKDLKFPPISKRGDEYDFATLVDKLIEVKQAHQTTEDIIIAPQAETKYDTIIKVMDRCRESGFPNISISG